MNANHNPKAKKPRLERYANQIVLALVVYVVLYVSCLLISSLLRPMLTID